MTEFISAFHRISNSSHRLHDKEIYVLMRLNYQGFNLIIYSDDCNDRKGTYGGSLKIDTDTDLGIYVDGTMMNVPSEDQIEQMIERKVNDKLLSMVSNQVIMNMDAAAPAIEERIKGSLASSILGKLEKFTDKQQEQFCVELESL